MRIRDAVLAYQETQSSDNSTKTIDLDIVDPISALGFEFEATTGTTSNINNPLHRCITKIELVDGSDVLASMNFEEIQALQFYKTGKLPEMRLDERAAASEVISGMMFFGRRLYDQEYALNLALFKNPQLKISWNLAKVRPVATDTAWGTGSLKISAWAKIMQDFPSPGKYLMDKKIDEWTGGSSGDKRRELPLDYPYRMLMLRGTLAAYSLHHLISKFKLTCDTDKFIALERYTKQWGSEMMGQFGNAVAWKRGFGGSGDTTWLPLVCEPHTVLQTYGGAQMGMHTQMNYQWDGTVCILQSDVAGGAVATDRDFEIVVVGYSPHACLPIPMGDLDRPDTWFDPTPYRKMELICTEGSGAGELAIVAEQVRPC